MGKSTYHNGIETLDHPVIAAYDLIAARQTFDRFGFTVPPRGSHVEWGTGNLCIMFPNDYLEIRGIIDASRFTMHLDTHLEHYGEGIMGVAFGTSDIQSSHDDCVRNGIDAGAIRHLTRNFEHTDGWTQPEFELFAPASADIDGLMHVVVLKHLTPELIRRPEFLAHANGCVGVNSLAGTIDDVEQTAEKMQKLVGTDAVSKNEHGVRVRLPTGQVIELFLPEAYAARYGDSIPNHSQRLGTVTMRVTNLEAAGTLLRGNGVDYDRPAVDRLRIPPAEACGATLEFTESAPA